MRYILRVFAEGERLPTINQTITVDALDVGKARAQGLAQIDEREVWDGWQDEDTDSRVTRFLFEVIRET